MIKFFTMADADLNTLAYNMTKFMNSIQRNGGVVLSTDVIKDVVNAPFAGIVFYSETRKRGGGGGGGERVYTNTTTDYTILSRLTDDDILQKEADK